MSTSSTVALKITILGTAIVDIEDVPWTEGMNAQGALEAAYNTREDAGFVFSLAYYGYDPQGELLGYYVEEIEQIGDQPHVYWKFAINGADCKHGIDQVTLRPGDAVSFTYAYYDDEQISSNAQLATKHSRKASKSN